MNDTLTIGQVAQRAGMGVETIRFYERQGLIEEPPRRPSGYRQYAPEVVARLRFIRRAKELGFTLEEVRELLELRVDEERTCDEVRARAEAKLEDISGKIAELVRMRSALREIARACRGSGPTSECPILDALDAEGLR